MTDTDWQTVVVQVDVGVRVPNNMTRNGSFDSAQELVDDIVGDHIYDIEGMKYRGVSNMEYEN